MWLGEEDWLDTEGMKFLYWRDRIEADGWRRSTRTRAYWVDDTQDIPPDDNIYRVHIDPDNGCVKVACIGMEKVDAIVDGNYSGTDVLPDWMQEKLAVLRMMSPKPPTEMVVGVGRRINNDTYWVFC
jgi:hypothetical protein